MAQKEAQLIMKNLFSAVTKVQAANDRLSQIREDLNGSGMAGAFKAISDIADVLFNFIMMEGVETLHEVADDNVAREVNLQSISTMLQMKTIVTKLLTTVEEDYSHIKRCIEDTHESAKHIDESVKRIEGILMNASAITLINHEEKTANGQTTEEKIDDFISKHTKPCDDDDSLY